MARIPYGVYVEHLPSGFNIKPSNIVIHPLYKENEIDDYICDIDVTGGNDWNKIENFKPYLFPLSSLTYEQKHEFFCRFIENEIDFIDFQHYYFDVNRFERLFTSVSDVQGMIEWFHKNHIDYRNLIGKSLANDASKIKIY